MRPLFFDTWRMLPILSKKMIYINDNTARIVLPRVSKMSASADTLRLISTIDRKQIDVRAKVQSDTRLSLVVSVTLPKLDRGEYRYELLNKGEVVSRGLAMVEMENNEYKQYGEQEEYIQAE